MTLHNITWTEDDQDGETCREMEMSKYAAFILHNNKDAAKLLFQKCKNLIKRNRPALIVTPEIITTDVNYLKYYPEGLLAVRRKPQSNYEQSMISSIDLLINATKYLIYRKHHDINLKDVNFQRDLQLSERTQPIPEFRKHVFTEIFRRFEDVCCVRVKISEFQKSSERICNQISFSIL